MKNIVIKIGLIAAVLCSSNLLFAQSGNSSSLVLGIIIFIIAALLALVLIVGNDLMLLQAHKVGVDTNKKDMSIFASLGNVFSPKSPKYVGNASVTNLKQGFNIALEGVAEARVVEIAANTFAVRPPNFRGISPIPKVVVEVGAKVKAGDELFYDKSNPSIKFVAPVSGEVIAVNRGEKRAITEVVIFADKQNNYKQFEAPSLSASRETLVHFLAESGAWLFFKQRPFNKIAALNAVPKGIFISTFDTAPLAPDANLVVKGREDAFQMGLNVLAKLSKRVHLGLSANADNAPATAFTQAKGVEKHWFAGKHPAGNVGIQIHHIDPINAGECVWTLGVQEVITIGNLFLKGIFDAERIIAVTGAGLANPSYIRTHLGANVEAFLKGNVKGNLRVLSGDVLSGEKISDKGYLGFYDDQITVIEEGDYYEMFGWLVPSSLKPSISKTYPNFLLPSVTFKGDTNTHGEKRAFVVTGQYESVLPMDIYPQLLMKAILTDDIEAMENLGIYELVEEDIALCEFACTSKQPLQQILRKGLDIVESQG